MGWIKKLIVIQFALIIFCCISGCGSQGDTSSNIVQSQRPKLFVVFTDTDDQVHYHVIDEASKRDDEIAMHPIEDYPTGIIAKTPDILYFTSRTPDRTMQLFSLNTKTNQKQQLTFGPKIASVDFLKVDNIHSKIYMRVILQGKHIFYIATYDIKNGKIDVMNEQDVDTSFRDFDINPATGQMIGVVFSDSKDRERIMKANQLHVMPPAPTYQIKLYSNENPIGTEIATLNKEVFDISLASDGKHAFFSAIDSIKENSRTMVYSIDLTTHQLTPVFSDTSQFLKIRQPQLSSDGKGMYFLATKNNANNITDKVGNTAKPRGLFYYDLQTKQITEVFLKENGVINNYILLNK